ncbi:MAG: aminomethyl-transferring glycine dehydrogenase [Planctomycetota bacterium]|nr:aminomethyl-transferring glycine dehydrogenase [Planctomycetota bacterium]
MQASQAKKGKEFLDRHIGIRQDEISRMCGQLDVVDLNELVEEVIPKSIRTGGASESPARSEAEALARLKEMAAKNRVARSMIGMGYSACHTPSVILRNVLENPGWYTAYTPYQPEISQGRLEALLNFQTVVTDLTGFAVANASLLDEGTAAAEAMSLCLRSSKQQSRKFFVSQDVHPQTIEVLRTRALPQNVTLVVGDTATEENEGPFFGALFQYPGSSGEIADLAPAIESIQADGGLVVLAADILSLTLLKPPAELGADIAIGSTQRLGVPLFYGGPHAAFFATHEKYKRALPGRIIGVSRDRHEKTALRMALQTREQHIRRDKATSNICTAQSLLAVTAAFFAMYHGPEGLTAIASRIHRLTCLLAAHLSNHGLQVVNRSWFDTLTIKVADAGQVHRRSESRGINFRYVNREHVGVSLDETTTEADIQDVLLCFLPEFDDPVELAEVWSSIPESLSRTSPFLQHEVFHRYQTETEMMRYLRNLSDRDLALDRTMIPLGSCTMKLNSATEMLPISWPEFANIHPFAPSDQTIGYQEMIAELEGMLCDATGYDAVSLQPNAGSQGEFSGLLAIQAYHQNLGEAHRRICLIPESAHGTNPASAQMVGLEIVVVKCDDSGNVDIGDLTAKAEEHANELSSLMITYPSTHGVFEENIREICDVIHRFGGQVYIDGANLNAQVGLCFPGEYGGDVSHLNLHKTFCIPHGGGGPGVGPVAVKDHLAPFLPSEKNFNLPAVSPGNRSDEQATPVGAVSSAPFGSAGILPISWAYIYMMGSEGLKTASQVAILNANYVANRLQECYPILYRGDNGRVAHECILDIRPITQATGISVDDIAKRLIDFGFHAPTMSFPVAGTLMVEPTESESRWELDRFCDAMIAIREEINKVESGEFDQKNNPLTQAPHTAEEMTADDWDHPYPRSVAAYPMQPSNRNKYWPPVGRLDHAFGDRNVVCSCPPLEDYQS